jgi:ribosomal protein S18 acetylase RimI-like enzyme
MTISIVSELDTVDWRQLKADLAADRFDNGRTPEQLRRSFERTAVRRLAMDENRVVGTIRVLSDGVCNAYLVDLWTHADYRRRGIASKMARQSLAALRGQHVALFAQGPAEFFETLGFETEPGGMSRVIGTWLSTD